MISVIVFLYYGNNTNILYNVRLPTQRTRHLKNNEINIVQKKPLKVI